MADGVMIPLYHGCKYCAAMVNCRYDSAVHKVADQEPASRLRQVIRIIHSMQLVFARRGSTSLEINYADQTASLHAVSRMHSPYSPPPLKSPEQKRRVRPARAPRKVWSRSVQTGDHQSTRPRYYRAWFSAPTQPQCCHSASAESFFYLHAPIVATGL